MWVAQPLALYKLSVEVILQYNTCLFSSVDKVSGAIGSVGVANASWDFLHKSNSPIYPSSPLLPFI